MNAMYDAEHLLQHLQVAVASRTNQEVFNLTDALERAATRTAHNAFLDIAACIARQRLTVLVTHWWEYFPDGGEDRPFINALHQTAEYLASRRDVRVVSFDDVAAHRVALN